MASIIHPLLALLASLSRQELARQVTYLRAENQILRSKLPDRITLSNQERRKLVRHGKKLGARIKEVISIVSYSTFRRWVRQMEGEESAAKPSEPKPAAPPVLHRHGEIVFGPINPLFGCSLALSKGFAERLHQLIPVELILVRPLMPSCMRLSRGDLEFNQLLRMNFDYPR